MRGRGRAAVVLGLSGLLLLTTLASAREPTVGKEGLSFRLPDLEGKLHALADSLYRGQVVYITAWGTWCPPCLSEIPFLQSLHDEYDPRGLRVVAIAFEKGADAAKRREGLRHFVTEREIGYTVLDGGSTKDFAQALPGVDHVKGLPVEFLVDHDGATVLVRNSYGYSEKWARDLTERIESLLRARDAAAP